MMRFDRLNQLLSFVTAAAVWMVVAFLPIQGGLHPEDLVHIPFLIVFAFIGARAMRERGERWARKAPYSAALVLVFIYGYMASLVTVFVGYQPPPDWADFYFQDLLLKVLNPLLYQGLFFPFTIMGLVILVPSFGYLFKKIWKVI